MPGWHSFILRPLCLNSTYLIYYMYFLCAVPSFLKVVCHFRYIKYFYAAETVSVQYQDKAATESDGCRYLPLC